MKIPLNPDAKPVNQRPYCLNPRYKERVKAQLDRMLDAGIIEPVEESEWISPMVVQDNKIGEVQIYVDLSNLNDACLHDTFPMSFTDEVLEGVGGQEIYSFIDGFFDWFYDSCVPHSVKFVLHSLLVLRIQTIRLLLHKLCIWLQWDFHFSQIS